jgi:prolyl-tRNA synthetase
MSELFLRTLRDDPADAEVPSHKLLIRAGYIRPIGPGLYSWLPLGLRVLRKIEKVVRDEMNAIGGQEILFPALLPRAPYETTNRWTEYGDGVFRLKDRRNNDYLLGPTHEELFALTVKGSTAPTRTSRCWCTKSRRSTAMRPAAGGHPARPRVHHEGLLFIRRRRRWTQGRLPRPSRRLPAHLRQVGVRYVIVSAVSGAMGGSASEEFWPKARSARHPSCGVCNPVTPPMSRR